MYWAFCDERMDLQVERLRKTTRDNRRILFALHYEKLLKKYGETIVSLAMEPKFSRNEQRAVENKFIFAKETQRNF